VALVARGTQEQAYIAEVRASLARQTVIVAWQEEQPTGAKGAMRGRSAPSV